MNFIVSVVMLIAGIIVGGDDGMKMFMISGIFAIAESIYGIAKAIEKK